MRRKYRHGSDRERVHLHNVCGPRNPRTSVMFLSLKDLPSQDATGIMSAITSAFADIGLPELREKMVFLASDGASVNSGVKTGLAVKFRESGQEWLLFVWCLSHRLELALKDSCGRDGTNKKVFDEFVLSLRKIFKETPRT